MNKFIGCLWLLNSVMYIFGMFEPTRFGMIMTTWLLSFYSFNDKK